MLAKDLWIQVSCLFLLTDLAWLAGAAPKVKVKQHKVMTSPVPVDPCPHPCVCQLGEAYCDGSSIDVIPLGLPEGLTKVNFMDNHIKRITKKHIGHLRYLKSLNFRRNQVDNVESGVFEHMNQLQALTFRENYIKRVNRLTFQGLNNLEFLSFRSNKLKSIEGAFQDLHHLKLLSLGENKISHISGKTFTGNGRLQYLDMHNNSITFINKNAFVNLHMLKYLILRDNPIKLVDLNFKKNFHLELLDFTNCELQEMIQGLPTSMRDLRVAENNIKTLTPRDFQKTRKIRLLVLSGNNLQHIYNDTFKPLRFLDELEISNNSLSILPQKLPKTLRKLTCANNSLTHIHEDDFQDNVNIEHLSLKQNQIQEVDMNAFKGLVKLKTLDLSRNNIGVLQPALFEQARKLELLDLSFNPITAVEHNCFLGLDNLHILEMSSVDAGQNFQPAVFKDTTHLLYLDLSNSSNVARHLAENPYILNYISSVEDLNLMYNSLYSLPESFARNLPNLRSLKLIGNPWHCDASIYWMTNWLKNNSVNFFEADSILCASPPKLQGRRVDSLTLRELPTVAPPLVDFIPTIEIIQINFHHNETFKPYRNNPGPKKPNEPLKEFTYEQSEDFVAKHPKPTLPSSRFSKTSSEGLLPKKNKTPTRQTMTTTQLTTATPKHKQTTVRKVSTETVTTQHISTARLTQGVTQGATLKPDVALQTTPVISTAEQITPTPEITQALTTDLSTSQSTPSTSFSEEPKSTDIIYTTSSSPVISTTQTSTQDATTAKTTALMDSPTTLSKHDTTSALKYASTPISTSQTTQTSTEHKDIEHTSPETSFKVKTQYTSVAPSIEKTSTSSTKTTPTKPPSSPKFNLMVTKLRATQSSTETTESTTTSQTTTQHPTTTKSTTPATTSDTTPHESRVTSATTKPDITTTSKAITEMITRSTDHYTTDTTTKDRTLATTEHTTVVKPYETKHHKPHIHTLNTTRTLANTSTAKQHKKTRKDENEPTIARITIRRFTQAPPKIYWATTANPPVTAKPSERTTEQELASETLIPYKERHHVNDNIDDTRTYDIVDQPPDDNGMNRRPFSRNEPFDKLEPIHRIRHQGNRNHGHRNHGKPHANKPFQGTQLWWSNSDAGPFSSLNNEKFSNVKNHGRETQKTHPDINDNGENYDNPWHTKTRGHSSEQTNHDVNNKNHNAPWSINREPSGGPWGNNRGHTGASRSNSRSHTYAFTFGEIDRAGSLSQEIDDPSSGEYDIF